MIRRLLITAVVLVATSGASAEGRLLPIDQAALVPEFFSFRAQLSAAIARRDVDHVLNVLSKDAKLSFGGDVGVEDFKKFWQPDSPDSRLWEVLATTLALGGTFSADGTFTAPYVFTNWPQNKDAFTHMATIGSGVRVRSEPAVSATQVSALDFTIVEIADQAPTDAKWVRVKFAANRTGFVDAKYLRSPIDYRINFGKLDGRWQIVFFLAGD